MRPKTEDSDAEPHSQKDTALFENCRCRDSRDACVDCNTVTAQQQKRSESLLG